MARERFDEALREFRAAERLSPHVDRAIGMRIAINDVLQRLLATTA